MAGYTDLLGAPRGPVGQRHAATSTPQRQAIKGRADMSMNQAGGYTFNVDDFTALRRFLVLGTDSGTYYVSASEMSESAMKLVDRCIEADPIKFVDTLVDVSVSGAPLKQSPCIFALARACSKMTGDVARDTNMKDPVTVGRAYALANAPKVLRTFSHTFEFLDYVRRQRGAGTGLKNMLGKLVLNPDLGNVEYQALKYRERSGWSPRDLLRYAHPKPDTAERENLLGWIVKPEGEKGRAAVAASSRLAAFEKIRDPSISVTEAAKLIAENKFTHEFVPNTMLGEKAIWEALLPNLPATALIRNLRKMTQVGLLVDGSPAIKVLKEKLTNRDYLRKARVHPLRIMGADNAYRGGTSRYGHGGDFTPSGAVLGVLEEALELSWSEVEPLNKHVLMAIDSSGSMSSESPMAGLSAFHAGLALGALYKRTEEECTLMTFDYTAKILNVSNRVTFQELKKTQNPGGATNCAAPLELALKNDINPDVIILLTDNATWAGDQHYVEALAKLRKRAKGPIANVTVATTATRSTVGDPNDPHSLEVVGFDPTVPEAIAAHVKEVFR